MAEALKTDTRVIPVVLEACDWENHQLNRFEVLPDKGRPINTWKPESEGWQNVVEGIRKTIHKMQGLEDSSSKISERELNAELAFQHGNILMMFGKIDKAIDAYSQAVKLNPRDADAYNNRGVAFEKLGEVDRTIRDYDMAIAIKPNDAAIYNNRGAAYVDKGEVDRGIVDFDKATGLNPNYVEPYFNRVLPTSRRARLTVAS